MSDRLIELIEIEIKTKKYICYLNKSSSENLHAQQTDQV